MEELVVKTVDVKKMAELVIANQNDLLVVVIKVANDVMVLVVWKLNKLLMRSLLPNFHDLVLEDAKDLVALNSITCYTL
jgi:hypothetical protein